MNPLVAIGVLLNGALYLTAVIAVGVAEHNFVASRLGVAGFGVAFLGYAFQVGSFDRAAKHLVAWSWIIGAAAGIALLF